MPRLETSRMRLSYGWLRGEDWWGDPVSDNFVYIDMLLHPMIESITESTPPTAGVRAGDMYIVAESGTDAWLDRDGQLALRTATGWIFATPLEGVRARLRNPASWIWFDGQSWLDESRNSSEPVPILGTRYDIAVSVGYEAEAGEVLLVFTVPEPMTMLASAAGSWGRAMVPPNGIMRLIMKRNGTEIGTITYASNTPRAIFTVMGDKPFATGDLLSVHVPDNPPPGFQNYAATLRLILATNGGTT